ncbi:hypothetical protein BS17DRAFT_811386 [Gyrodon lividus]|nr:hypothetical protein BS17DRAFT_811386 [Gyrodon lividus]
MWATIMDYLFPKIPLQPLPVAEDGGVVCFGGARKHWVIKDDAESYSVRYKYFVSHPNARGGRSSGNSNQSIHSQRMTDIRELAVTPPPHYHVEQSETLAVVSGRLGYMLNGVVHTAGPGETTKILPHQNHSFWAEPGEDLVFDLTATPGEGLNGDFLDNFDGYLTSAQALGKRVPFLQLMVFCYDSQTIVVMFPPLDRLIVTILGGFVGPLVGYKPRYNELQAQKSK